MEQRQFVDPQFSRQLVDNIRRKFENLPNKTPEEHQIELEFVDFQQDVKICLLTIRSGAKNCLSGRMISQLTEKLDQIEQWIEQQPEDLIKCGLLIRGHGGTFCSGSDLISARGTLDQLSGLEVSQVMQYNMWRIQNLPITSCAFVEGYALGGGAELTLAPDFRLMAPNAKIGFVHSRNGICCGWGGGTRLIHLVGRSRGLEIFASGRLVGADEAQRIQLATSQCSSLDEALHFLAGHSICSKRTSRAFKLLANSAQCLPYANSLLVETQLFAATWGQAPHLRSLDGNFKHKEPSKGS